MIGCCDHVELRLFAMEHTACGKLASSPVRSPRNYGLRNLLLSSNEISERKSVKDFKSFFVAKIHTLLSPVAETTGLVRTSRSRSTMDSVELSEIPTSQTLQKAHNIALLFAPDLLHKLVSSHPGDRSRPRRTRKRPSCKMIQRGSSARIQNHHTLP